jgi:hypothetical protein
MLSDLYMSIRGNTWYIYSSCSPIAHTYSQIPESLFISSKASGISIDMPSSSDHQHTSRAHHGHHHRSHKHRDPRPEPVQEEYQYYWTWTCCNCGHGGMTTRITHCPDCHRVRCDTCPLQEHKERVR